MDDSTKQGSEVRYWLGEIAGAKKREKTWRKDGEEINDIYCGKKNNEIPFNILFSNVETLLPALFSQTPRPVVVRRFKDEDPLGNAASKAAQRMLEFLCDTNVEGYETFDQSMRFATLDALLPGRCLTSIKYDAESTYPTPPEEGEEEGVPVVQWEQVCTDSRSWNKVYFGYARKWSKVPWLAYEEYMDEEEAEKMFGKEAASKITYTKGEEEDDEEDESGTGGRDDAEDAQGGRKTALVYQIWDKTGGKVIRYVSPQYADGYLKVDDDPLGLTGFFNCPRPLQFIEKSNDLLPVAMYKLYENQAKELNRITRRLNRVIEAIKVRGVYDGSLGEEIEKVLKEDDNGLVPTDKSSSLAAEGGLEKAIWFMPIEKLIVVATNLVQAREACKRVIYEITGVSDIIRGQSVASETLGAQKIKESWGTMRLKRLQKEVQRYTRDVLRIMVEIAATKFSERTWAQATGLPFTTEEQAAQAQMIVQAAQMQGQQPDQQAMQALQSPMWKDVLGLLRDDMQRSFRVDIETNTTIDVEATEDQKNIGDFMNAMGQMMAGLTPMVEKGAMTFEAAQSILLAVLRRFRFGSEVEDQFKAMKAPPPKDDGKAAEAQATMQFEQQKLQGQMQLEQQKLQNDMQLEQAKLQMAQQVETAKHEREVQSAQDKMNIEMQKLQLDREMQLLTIQANREAELAKMQSQRETEKIKMKLQCDTEVMKMKMNQETEMHKASEQVSTQVQIARIGKQNEDSGKDVR